jgi:hypothetical protein
MKASQILQDKGDGYDAFLLNFPVEMEDRVVDLAAEQVSYDELIDEIGGRDLIPEPVGSWEYDARPILKVLPQLARRFPHLTILCYGSREDEFASTEVAVRVARLTLRTALTGEVEHGEWRETLQAYLEVDSDATKNEAEKILRKAGESSICISDLGGRRFNRALSMAGLEVKILYVEKPYHFTPLMILRRKMARGDVEDGELERLVRSHVEYIRSYIYRFRNRDRAHYEWVYDKVPWLRRRIDREEIKLLDSLIDEPWSCTTAI